MKDKDTLSLVY